MRGPLRQPRVAAVLGKRVPNALICSWCAMPGVPSARRRKRCAAAAVPPRARHSMRFSCAVESVRAPRATVECK